MLLEVALIVEEALHINSGLINYHTSDLSSILIAENALNHRVHCIAHCVATFVTLARLKHTEVSHLRSRDLNHRRRVCLRLALERHHVSRLGPLVRRNRHRLRTLIHHVTRVRHPVLIHVVTGRFE